MRNRPIYEPIHLAFKDGSIAEVKKVLIRSSFLNFEGNPHYISQKIILDCLEEQAKDIDRKGHSGYYYYGPEELPDGRSLPNMRYTLQLEGFVNGAHRLLDVDLFGVLDITKPLAELFKPMAESVNYCDYAVIRLGEDIDWAWEENIETRHFPGIGSTII